MAPSANSWNGEWIAMASSSGGTHTPRNPKETGTLAIILKVDLRLKQAIASSWFGIRGLTASFRSVLMG